MSEKNSRQSGQANLNFKGLLAQEDVQKIEKNMYEQGTSRRMALVFLTMSREDMEGKFGRDEKGLDILLESVEHLQNYLDSLESCKEIAETAQARMLMILHNKAGIDISNSEGVDAR